MNQGGIFWVLKKMQPLQKTLRSLRFKSYRKERKAGFKIKGIKRNDQLKYFYYLMYSIFQWSCIGKIKG